MLNSEAGPLKRFSNRVDNYVKYRPGYPEEIMDFFTNKLNLKKNDKIADIGSGTGIFSEMLLKNDYTVYAVEPNKEMREASEKLLNHYDKFISINAAAESTGLEPQSIDLITSAQAFHWFKHKEAGIEFKRILKEDGWVVLIWNSRINSINQFMSDYENLLLKFAVEYSKVNHTNINRKLLQNFFSKYDVVKFPNKQSFDFEGLKGRVLSSSYAPDENNPKFTAMIKTLSEIFHSNAKNGIVDILYNTEVYYGKL
jgi:ubiquinone/menaquinone biosynthesis C-methylase UbiE